MEKPYLPRELRQGLGSQSLYDDYFFGQGICLIEWADLIEEILPEKLIKVTIEKDLEKGFDYRRITVIGQENS